MLEIDADFLESLGKPRIHEWTPREDEILLKGWKVGFKEKVAKYLGISSNTCQRRFDSLRGDHE